MADVCAKYSSIACIFWTRACSCSLAWCPRHVSLRAFALCPSAAKRGCGWQNKVRLGFCPPSDTPSRWPSWNEEDLPSDCSLSIFGRSCRPIDFFHFSIPSPCDSSGHENRRDCIGCGREVLNSRKPRGGSGDPSTHLTPAQHPLLGSKKPACVQHSKRRQLLEFSGASEGRSSG
jgi:hypothetical protein